MNIDPQVLVDKLNGMGSPEAIAKFLHDEGVIGEQGVISHCVVAEYIKRETGLVDVRVNSKGVCYGTD